MLIIEDSIRLEIECEPNKTPYIDRSYSKKWVVIIKGDTGEGGYFKVEGYGSTLVNALDNLNTTVAEREAQLANGLLLLSSLGYSNAVEVQAQLKEEHANWEDFAKYLAGSMGWD